MEIFELIADKREQNSSHAGKRLRLQGKVPGIIYGGKKPQRLIMLDQDTVMHHLEHESFYSHVLTLKIGKSIKEKVVLKDLQRHPHRHLLMHIDFLRISEDEKIVMRVPLHFINEDKCKGVKIGGGVISHLMTDLEIVCLPKDLPEYIEVEMTDYDVGDTIHVSHLNLPAGVQRHDTASDTGADLAVASVHLPKAQQETEEVVEEEETDTEQT